MSLRQVIAPLRRTASRASLVHTAPPSRTLARHGQAPGVSRSDAHMMARRSFAGSASRRAPEPALASSSSSSVQPPPAPAASSSSLRGSEEISSTSQALALLRTQPQHYVIASLVGRTFLLALSDIVTVPRLKDVRVGDVLELDRVHEVGSQDYTLRAQDPIAPRVRAAHYAAADAVKPLEGASSTTKWTSRLIPTGLAFTGAALRPETVRVRCVVIEHTKGKMEYIVKTKRRKGYRKTIKHKQPYTRLRVEEIRLGDA